VATTGKNTATVACSAPPTPAPPTVGVQLNLPLSRAAQSSPNGAKPMPTARKPNKTWKNTRRNVELQTRQAYLGVPAASPSPALQQA